MWRQGSEPVQQVSQIHNAKLELDVSQIWLCILMAIAFAALSLVIWKFGGKRPAYYVSQLVAIAFIFLALIFFAMKSQYIH